MPSEPDMDVTATLPFLQNRQLQRVFAVTFEVS